MAILLPNGRQSYQDAVGLPLVGGRLYTYAAGTSTPLATFADAANTVPNTNPVTLDARGEATIYWFGAYKVRLCDAADALIWEVDNVTTIDPLVAIYDAFVEGLAGTGGGALVGVSQNGSGAVMRTLQAKLRDLPDIRDYGAVCDRTNDDAASIQAAINANPFVTMPALGCVIGAPIVIGNGKTLVGKGRSAWEPYLGAPGGVPADFPATRRSEIIVDGTLAFDVTGSFAASLRGLSIKSLDGRQSAYGLAANCQENAAGIDITASSQFYADDVSFFGLETGVIAAQTGTPESAQMAAVTNWGASDCGAVFRIGTGASGAGPYTARDMRIGECVIALHCDSMIEAHYVDGLRLENLRLFQAYGRTIYVRKTPFLDMTGVTTFETRDDAVTLEECNYANLSGVRIARAGRYVPTDPPYPQKVGLTITGCQSVAFSGMISEATGASINISGSSGVSLNGTIDTPFWTTGNATNISGAINVLSSRNTEVNMSVNGSNGQVALAADYASAETLSGSLATDAAAGVVRAVRLQQHGGFIFTLAADVNLAVAGVAQVGLIRMFIPAGKRLRTRSVEVTFDQAALRANGMTWNAAQTSEPFGGSIALDDKVLYDNSAGPDGIYAIPISIVNQSAGINLVAAGTQVRISTALV